MAKRPPTPEGTARAKRAWATIRRKKLLELRTEIYSQLERLEREKSNAMSRLDVIEKGLADIDGVVWRNIRIGPGEGR